MKYTNSPVAFLCFFLGVTLTSFIPIVSAFEFDDDPFDCSADYVPQKPIDNFQLKTVGVSNLDANQDQDDKPSPVRVYLNKFGMTVHLFYEGHPDHVLDTDLVDVTLYAASVASSTPSSDVQSELVGETNTCRECCGCLLSSDSLSDNWLGFLRSTSGESKQFETVDGCVERLTVPNPYQYCQEVGNVWCGDSCDRRRLDDRSVRLDSVSLTAGIASSFKGEDEVLKRRHSLSAASDASGVSSGRRRMDDRSVTFDSVSPTAGIASSFKGEDEVLQRRLDSAGEDCTACDSTTVIEVNGAAFQTQISQCIGGNCQDGVPIGCWDTSAVTDMSYAFSAGEAALFDDSINCWNVESVTSMRNMFNNAKNFNQPLADWNVARVAVMQNMFREATNFNQSLDDWNVASVTDMNKMFQEASNFNQCLASWADNTPPNVNVGNIFRFSGCPNPSANLAPWCQDEDEQCSAPSELVEETNTCGECSSCLNPSGDCIEDDYDQTSCEQSSLVWCGGDTSTPSTDVCGECSGCLLGSSCSYFSPYNDYNYDRAKCREEGSKLTSYFSPYNVYNSDDQAKCREEGDVWCGDTSTPGSVWCGATPSSDVQTATSSAGTPSSSDIQTATSSADTPPPCGENSVALPSILYGVTLVSYNDDNYNGFFKQLDSSQCFPRTTNGVVAQAEIIMTENPFDLDSNLASLIYDESLGTNDGLLQFCARIAYLIGDDDDKELISYIDTKVVLDVSIAADIEFTQAVDISSDQTPVTTVNQDVSTVIDVDSFLCGDPLKNDGAPYGDAYSLGQSFRVCVDVKAADRGKFGLTNFRDVKCSTDSGLETIIVSLVNDVATAASILTTLFDNEATSGAKSVASGTPSTQIEASERAISFSTVVTNAYLTGDDDTLTCVGSVDVDTVTQRRQLVSFTVPNPVSSSLSAGRRQMEEDTGAVAGAVEFGATIKLSSSSAASGRFSPLPMTTDGIMGFLLVIGVGPMMMMMMW